MVQPWYHAAVVGTQKTGVRLIALGGTIAFAETPDGADLKLEGRDLLAGLQTGERVDVQDLARISSIAITDQHLLGLAHAVERSIADGYASIVITHGTDTLEETAYFLALTIERARAAIVLTAAMRHSGLLERDGPANLQTALQVAQLPGLAEAGPVVAMANEIHAARFVTKRHTSNLSAFASATGPIGQVMENRAELWFQPAYEDHVGMVDGDSLPRVELVTMAVGNEGTSLQAVIDTDPAGLVIAGLGGGHAPPQLLGCVDDAISRGIPVIIASRCSEGPTLRATYAIPGTEIDLQARGAIMCGTLSAPKARLRLAVALANHLQPKSVFPVD
jgi:L-asparaginase